MAKEKAKAASAGAPPDPKATASNTPSDPNEKGPVEPKDPAPGKPKVDESAPPGQQLAAGGGSEVFMNTPLVRGIPVVVPVVEGVETDAETVMGVALAAPVVPGVPEMISNAQAEFAVENQDWKKGDVKSVSWNNGETMVDVVQDDGTVKTERHVSDLKTHKEFEEAIAKDPKAWKKNAKAFYGSKFSDKTLIEEPV